MNDSELSGIICADFRTLEGAQDWRTKLGGWIFLSCVGNITWFAPEHTPSMILDHAKTKGVSGSLI